MLFIKDRGYRMNVKFEIDGVDKTVMKLAMLNTLVRAEALRAMKRSASIVEKKAKEIITDKGHVKTGNLRRNIKSKAGYKGMFVIEGVIGTDVPYAPYIESLPDGGFLYPALMSSGREALIYLKGELARVILGGSLI